MIKDAVGNELFYWPISNLAAGENSEVIIIRIETPSDGKLKATDDDRINMWAKWMQFPLNPFTNISDGPGINLSGIPGPYAEFAIYVEAVEPIDGAFIRVPITVVVSISRPAGWIS